MIRFTEFREMAMIGGGVSKPDRKTDMNNEHRIDLKKGTATKIGSWGNYNLYRSDHPKNKTQFSGFRAVHKDTGDVHYSVSGIGKGRKFEVDKLLGHPDREGKAHEFYHRLVTKHGYQIHSDSILSPGGARVWKRLAKSKGVKVTRSDTGKQFKGGHAFKPYDFSHFIATKDNS